MKFLSVIASLAFVVLVESEDKPKYFSAPPVVNERVEKRELQAISQILIPKTVQQIPISLVTDTPTFKKNQQMERKNEQKAQTTPNQATPLIKEVMQPITPKQHQNLNPNGNSNHNPQFKKHEMKGRHGGQRHQNFNHHQNPNIPQQIQNDPFKWNTQQGKQIDMKEYKHHNKHIKHGHLKHGGYINDDGQFINGHQFGNGQQPHHHKGHTLGCLLFFGFVIILIALLIKGLKKCCKKRRCRRESQGQPSNLIDHQILFHEEQIRRLQRYRNKTIMNPIPQAHETYPVNPQQSFEQQQVSFVPRQIHPMQRNVPVGRPLHNNNFNFTSEYPSI